MPRLRTSFVPFVFLGVFGAGMSSCAPNEVSFLIVQNQASTFNATTNACVATSNISDPHRSVGTLDVFFRTEYLMYPLYYGDLVSSINATVPYAESRSIIIDGADVDLRVGAADGLRVNLAGQPNPYRVDSNGFLPAGMAGQPSYAAGQLNVIPSAVGAALRTRVCGMDLDNPTNNEVDVYARVRPLGHTQGQISLTGGEFNYLIHVCCRCLLTYPPGSDNPATSAIDCSVAPTTTVQACSVGQDDPVTCQECQQVTTTNNPQCLPGNALGSSR